MEESDIQRVKKAAGAIMADITAFASGRGLAAAVERLATVADQLAKGQLNVVVCGEFKQGKTSLISALLREPRLLPIDTDIATAAVTRIAWGERERIVAYVEDGGATEAVELGRDQLREYIVQINNENGARRVRLVDIALPNALLAGGLVIVDTPGIGGIAIEHSEITYGFLPQADLILFVTSAQAPMTEHEIAFLRERVMPFNRDVIVAVNRIDRQRDWRTIIQENEAKLQVAFSDQGRDVAERIRVMPCSSGQFLGFLRTHDPLDAEESLVPGLEAAIVAHLSFNGATLLALRAIDGSGKILGEIKAPIQTAHAVLTADSAEALRQLEDDLAQSRQRLDELRSKGAAWRSELSSGFADIRQELHYAQHDGSLTLRADFNRRLGDGKQLADPSRIGRDTAADLQTHRALLNQTAMDLVVALRAKVSRSARVVLPGAGSMTIDAGLPGQAPGLHGARRKQTLTRRAFTAGRMTVVSTTAGGAIGGMLGAVVGGAIGAIFGGVGAVPGATLGSYLGGLAGSAFGGLQGLREGLELVEQRESGDTRKAVFDILEPFISSEMLRIHRAQEDALRDAERATIAEFETEIETAQTINRDQIGILMEQKAASQADVAGRLQDLNGALRAIAQFEARLAEAAAHAAGTEPAADAGADDVVDSWSEDQVGYAADPGMGR
jgi:predicted GTPase/outer membrane lipoprotein SlyB